MELSKIMVIVVVMDVGVLKMTALKALFITVLVRLFEVLVHVVVILL